jgi:hypothetical protein
MFADGEQTLVPKKTKFGVFYLHHDRLVLHS